MHKTRQNRTSTLSSKSSASTRHAGKLYTSEKNIFNLKTAYEEYDNVQQGQSSRKSEFKEEAMEVILKAVGSEENSSAQALAASILSNLGGTHAWTGEPYTAAWLVRKAGLTSVYQRNMIRSVDWLDPCLQVSDNRKISKSIL